jgi:hypothetical protein
VHRIPAAAKGRNQRILSAIYKKYSFLKTIVNSNSPAKVQISEQKTKRFLSFLERERSALPLLPS